MASVTEEIKKKRNKLITELNQTGRTEADQSGVTTNELAQDLSHRRLTQREQDNGTGSVSHNSSAELTGKLCRHVMALIQWKVGADIAVTEHVVWVLEEWLHRRGISIYTDLL
jgi:hypothetical protein